MPGFPWNHASARRCISGKARILAVFSFLVLFRLPAQEWRGFTAEELREGIRTEGRVEQIHEGDVIDYLRVSRDGKWIAYTQFAGDNPDIHDNEIRLVSTDGTEKLTVEAPYGYKDTPALHGGYYERGTWKPLTIFVSVAGNGELPDGIYTARIEDDRFTWRLWEKGPFRDLSFDDTEAYLMASTGNWRTRNVRSHVVVWPLDSNGGQDGKAYMLAPELRGQVKKIVMTPDREEVIFCCIVDHPERFYGIGNIYRARNREGAPAELLFLDAWSPSIRRTSYGYMLYYENTDKMSDTAVVRRYGSVDKTTRDVVTLIGIHPNGLEVDPRSGRIYLGVQASLGVAGLLAIEEF